MPKKAFATRIENRSGGGVPDVHVVWDGLAFWLELKVANCNRLQLSPHQIAWNMAYHSRGGLSFYLVKTQGTHPLKLFTPTHGKALALSGLSGSEGREFRTAAEFWEYISTLRPDP